MHCMMYKLELSYCVDGRAVLHKSDSEKMGWVSFREKLEMKCASTVINDMMPKQGFFGGSSATFLPQTLVDLV